MTNKIDPSQVFSMLKEASNTFSGILAGQKYKNVTRGQRDDAILTKFLLWLIETQQIDSIGPYWIYQYCCYQYKQYIDSEVVQQKKAKAVALLFGQKAIERWNRRPDSWWYWCQTVCTQFDEATVLRYIAKPVGGWQKRPKVRKTFANDEREREIGFMSQNFAHCVEYTSLYDEMSIWCKNCEWINTCKQLRKVNYE